MLTYSLFEKNLDDLTKSLGISDVNQGAILSPFLFTSFLADMVEYLDKKVGIQLDDDTTLTHLLWADDLILFSTPEGLQCQIDKLFTYCCRWQLIVNTAKTKIMCFNRPTRRKEQHTVFYFNDEEIEIVPKYKYVGCVFSSAENVFNNHVKYTLEKARCFQSTNMVTTLGNSHPGYSANYLTAWSNR